MHTIDPHSGITTIDHDTCLALLRSREHGIGRLAMIEGTKPTIVPVNYVMYEDRVVFRTGPGTKLAVAERGAHVAFEIDNAADGTKAVWSIVVRGRAEIVVSRHRLDQLAATELVPYATQQGKDTWVVIHPESITGRRLDVPGHP